MGRRAPREADPAAEENQDAAPGIDLAGGAPGHLLHDAPAHRTWIDTRPPGPVLQRQTTAVETLDLSNHAWANADPALM